MELKEYLQAPIGGKRAVLKKHYLTHSLSSKSEREQALYHLDHLVDYTRRINMVEYNLGNQQVIKPSAVLASDLFICVELCAESIHENVYLQTKKEFQTSWCAFMNLLRYAKLKEGSDSFFEAVFLLLHIAASVFRQHIGDGAVQKEPHIISHACYSALAAKWPYPIFNKVESSFEQLANLTQNLNSMRTAPLPMTP